MISFKDLKNGDFFAYYEKDQLVVGGLIAYTMDGDKFGMFNIRFYSFAKEMKMDLTSTCSYPGKFLLLKGDEDFCLKPLRKYFNKNLERYLTNEFQWVRNWAKKYLIKYC